MNKLFITSDIHFEFFDKYEYEPFIKGFPDCDIIVLAGDIVVDTNCYKVIPLLAEIHKDKQIVYVNGNHEFYLAYSRQQMVNKLRYLANKHENFHYLDNEVVEIEGLRFVGTPLWFQDQELNIFYKNAVNCFKFIPDFQNWVYQENVKACEFLEKNLQAGDILVTHYLPSYACVDRGYRGNNANRFYVCEIMNMLLDKNPLLAIHGHSHSHSYMNEKFGETVFYRNPSGYKNELKFGYKDEVITIENGQIKFLG